MSPFHSHTSQLCDLGGVTSPLSAFKITKLILEGLPFSRHGSKHFPYINSFSPQDSPKKIMVLSHIHQNRREL